MSPSKCGSREQHADDSAKPIFLSEFFYDEMEATTFLEACRWPDTHVCPRCGSQSKIYELNSRQVGLKKCGVCVRTFNAKTGTLFEDSRIPLNKWFQFIYLVVFSPLPIGIVELSYTVKIAYKTSWRINRIVKDKIKIDEFENGICDVEDNDSDSITTPLSEILKNGFLKEREKDINFIIRAAEFSYGVQLNDFKKVICDLIDE